MIIAFTSMTLCSGLMFACVCHNVRTEQVFGKNGTYFRNFVSKSGFRFCTERRPLQGFRFQLSSIDYCHKFITLSVDCLCLQRSASRGSLQVTFVYIHLYLIVSRVNADHHGISLHLYVRYCCNIIKITARVFTTRAMLCTVYAMACVNISKTVQDRDILSMED